MKLNKTTLNYFSKKLWNSPTFTTWGQFGTRSLSFLLVTPLIITKFTTDGIAAWYLFATIISVSDLFDLGFKPTISRLFSYGYGGTKDLQKLSDGSGTGKPNWEIIERIFNNASVIYVIISLVAFLLLATIGTWALLNPISKMENPMFIWYAWITICCSIPLTFLGKKYSSVLIGLNYVSLYNRWSIFFNLIIIFSSFLILIYGGNIFHLIASIQIFRILQLIRDRFLLHSIEDGKFKTIGSLTLDKKTFHVIWNASWRSAIGISSSFGVIQISGILFAQFGDTKEIAEYLFSFRLISMAMQFSQAPFYSKLPLYVKLRAEGNLNKLEKITGNNSLSTLVIFTMISFFLLVFSEPILELIGSKVEIIDEKLWIMMSFFWLLDKINSLHIQIFSTTNKIVFYKFQFISALLYLLFLYFTLDNYGIWAIILGYGFSRIVIFNIYPIKYSLRSIKSDYTFFIKYNLSPILLFIFLNGIYLVF